MAGSYKTIKNIRWVVIFSLLLSVIIFPWWFYVSLSIIALFYFDDFYEIVFVAFAMDSLYATGLKNTLIALLFFIISIYIKKCLIFFIK